MTTLHNCVLMKVGGGKVAFMSVVDEDTVPMKHEIQLMVAETSYNEMTKPNVQMILHTENTVDVTGKFRGMGIAGIFMSPVWCIQKIKSVIDLMYGG